MKEKMMKNIKLDLTKLMGFKIVATEKKPQNSVPLNAKIGSKPGVKPSK